MIDQFLGCVVLLTRGNSVLLGKRKNSYKAGWFGLPGGRVEVGEKLFDCAKREVAEETGISDGKLEYIGVVKENQGAHDFVHFVFTYANFSGEPQVVEPEKCESWEWFPIDQLPSPILEGHAAAIDIFLRNETTLRDI